jgi:hypothetical protein
MAVTVNPLHSLHDDVIHPACAARRYQNWRRRHHEQASKRIFVVGSICTLFASSASAEFKPTAAQRADCTGDAMSLCAYALARMDRVVACLAAKKSRLSPACRAHFEKH